MVFLNALLSKTSSVKNVCILFTTSHLILLSMMLYTFPVINSQIGTKAFDLQTFGYSLSDAERIVNSLNEETRDLYLFPQLTLLDLFYPLLLALFLGSFLYRLIDITDTKGKFIPVLLAIPFIGMICDYLENICIVLMISKSVDLTETTVLLSSVLTILKGVFTSITWMMLLVFSIKWGLSLKR